MQLRCKVCDAMQAVNTADVEDEDPRTQSIRRAFRAEHVAACGAGSVSLELYEPGLPPVDPAVWDAYIAHVKPPADVTVGGDGYFTRTITRDGQSHNVRVCEDCWQNIPRYVDFPAGLASPEGAMEHSDVPKVRAANVATDNPRRSGGLEHLLKAVCLPCFMAAFARVYPNGPMPTFSDKVVGDGAPVTQAPPMAAEELGRVTMTRPDEKVKAAA